MCYCKTGDIYEYKKNNIDCVCIRSDSLKYYKEFSEIQMFEKYLSEAKSGYVFFRDGDRYDDIEYRNTAKYKELEIPFGFIDQIRNQAINEVKIKNANYEKTETALNFTGYPNVEVFLQDLNNEESQTENESVVEDEENEELE